MLGMRILVSACLVPFLIALFWFDMRTGSSAWFLFAFCIAVTVRNCFELTQLLSVRSMKPSFVTTATLSVVVICCGWLHMWTAAPGSEFVLLSSLGAIAAGLIFAFCMLMLRECIVYREPGNSMESLGANAVTVLYAGGLLAMTSQFRWFPDSAIAYYALAATILAVKCGDIGAYSFGRLWGKKKMAPRLSPGKTWMGSVGAVVGSLIGGMSWLYFGGALFESSPRPSSLLNAAACCMFLGVVGLIGDLCESLIKRDCGKKDSAALMPGFGGLLDLLDSALFAGPFALAWWYLFPLV
jgi:phosphatidate cytidylyltransferase